MHNLSSDHQVRDTVPGKFWASICDDGPVFKQHWQLVNLIHIELRIEAVGYVIAGGEREEILGSYCRTSYDISYI